MKSKTTGIALMILLAPLSLVYSSQQKLPPELSQLQATIHTATQQNVPNDIIRLIDECAAKPHEGCTQLGHLVDMYNTSTIRQFLFTPDNLQMISVGHYPFVMVSDPRTGRVLHVLRGDANQHGHVTRCDLHFERRWANQPVIVSPNSKLMALGSVSPGNACHIVNLSDGSPKTHIRLIADEHIWPVVFTPDGESLIYKQIDQGTLYLQKLPSEQAPFCEPAILCAHIDEHIQSATFLGEDRLLLTTDATHTYFWNLTAKKCEKRLQNKELSLCPDHSTYVTFDGSTAHPLSLYNTQTHQKIRDFHDSTNQYDDAQFDRAGKKIVALSQDDRIAVWDTQNGRCLQQTSLAQHIPRSVQRERRSYFRTKCTYSASDDNVCIIDFRTTFCLFNIKKERALFHKKIRRGCINGELGERRTLGISSDRTMIAMEDRLLTKADGAVLGHVRLTEGGRASHLRAPAGYIRLYDLSKLLDALDAKIAKQERRQQHIARAKGLLRRLLPTCRSSYRPLPTTENLD